MVGQNLGTEEDLKREIESSPVKKNWGGWLVGWLITRREKNGNEEMKTLQS